MIDYTDNVVDLNAILHPGSVYDHPRDVVTDTTLSTGWSAIRTRPRPETTAWRQAGPSEVNVESCDGRVKTPGGSTLGRRGHQRFRRML